MSYDYSKEKGVLYTDEGIIYILEAMKAADYLLKESGIVTMGAIMNKLDAGLSWTQMAAIDFLVEHKYLIEVKSGISSAGQHRLFITPGGP